MSNSELGEEGICSCGNLGTYRVNQYQVEVNQATEEESIECLCDECEHSLKEWI